MPLSGCLSSRSCLYSWKDWLMPRRRDSSRCVTKLPTTSEPTTPRSVLLMGTMAWIMSPLSSSWTVVTSCPASPCLSCSLFTDFVGTLGADRRVPGVHDQHAAAVEDRDGGEPEPLLLAGDVRLQHRPLVRGHEALAREHVGHVARVAQGHGLLALIVRLRDLEGLVERPLHLRLEPAFDGRVDEVRRDDEDEDGRRQRERQEGEDKLGLEPRAQDLLPPLECELDQVAEEQDHQQQEDDQVQVEEREHGQVGGEGNLGRMDPDLEPPPRQGQEGEPAGHDKQVAPVVAPPVDRRVDQRAHWRLMGVSRGDWTQSDSAASPLKRAIHELTPLSETSARSRMK